MKSGKQTLVVYYSLTGNTERVARDIAARLGADLEKIEDKKARRGFFGQLGAALDSMRSVSAHIADIRNNPSEYALTIIGTPVWVSKMTPAVRAYLHGTRGRPSDVAFFTTSGNVDAAKIVPEMQALAGRTAKAFTGFRAGELKDASLYEKKISAFVQALQRTRA